MTHHYNLEIISKGLFFKITYRNKKFKKIEHVRGKIERKTIDAIGKVIPVNEEEISALNGKYFGVININIITTEKSDYTLFLEEWHLFYDRFTGIPAKFTGVDGNALKSIISHLKKISSQDETEALDLWKLILDNWKGLNEFHRANTDLKYINSKLNIILNGIKQKNNTNIKGTGYSVEL
ncbi:hypothetical protein [Tenacibaculum maritimum]|uniref:hypothetical protein n=1 Tax=Tenacibaculum maritimum TaxID=107401 RepID=UPI0012E684A8|nr:hypothetical protein [Tenacibaculum maritimum]CAA0248067.1 conserved hypothetical protein [Tenacibaculum maritimum]